MDMAVVGQFIEKKELKTPLPHDMTIRWLDKIYKKKKKKKKSEANSA